MVSNYSINTFITLYLYRINSNFFLRILGFIFIIIFSSKSWLFSFGKVLVDYNVSFLNDSSDFWTNSLYCLSLIKTTNISSMRLRSPSSIVSNFFCFEIEIVEFRFVGLWDRQGTTVGRILSTLFVICWLWMVLNWIEALRVCETVFGLWSVFAYRNFCKFKLLFLFFMFFWYVWNGS